MRFLLLLLFITSLAASEPIPAYPLWDNHESVADYAKRVNLPPTKTLDLGNGVKLELVLIPAGKFIMGTPKPVPVDEASFRKKIELGEALTCVCGATLLIPLLVVAARAIRGRKRPQVSLRLLTVVTVAAGGGVLSVLHWRQSVAALDKLRVENEIRSSLVRETEQPAHAVTLTRPFYLGKFAVTQEQFQQVMQSNPSKFKGVTNRPVEQVSWDATQKFCTAARALAKADVKLPNEAEWEFACRAGTATAYYSGDLPLTDADAIGWNWLNCKGTTHAVGEKLPNAFGLYDMLGNVSQWCRGWYYYSRSSQVDPVGNADTYYRMLRGGSAECDPIECRSAYRYWANPDEQGLFGFRIAV